MANAGIALAPERRDSFTFVGEVRRMPTRRLHIQVPPGRTVRRADALAKARSVAEGRRVAESRRAKFGLLADELQDAAGVVSSTRRLTRHPAYVGILALGQPAIPLLLERLKAGRVRPVWMRLLASLTSFQPGAGADTVEEAAVAWIQWGKYGGRLG